MTDVMTVYFGLRYMLNRTEIRATQYTVDSRYIVIEVYVRYV